MWDFNFKKILSENKKYTHLFLPEHLRFFFEHWSPCKIWIKGFEDFQ
jgi:hypothetical protein